ncbi:MAG: hypothetical protein WC312_05785, partial [Candidatus Omnitrophota bacterium]
MIQKNEQISLIKDILFFSILFFSFTIPVSAEITIAEKEEFTFAISPYFRTDAVAMKNTVDLDSNNKDDSTVYLGID